VGSGPGEAAGDAKRGEHENQNDGRGEEGETDA